MNAVPTVDLGGEETMQDAERIIQLAEITAGLTVTVDPGGAENMEHAERIIQHADMNGTEEIPVSHRRAEETIFSKPSHFARQIFFFWESYRRCHVITQLEGDVARHEKRLSVPPWAVWAYI